MMAFGIKNRGWEKADNNEKDGKNSRIVWGKKLIIQLENQW